MSGLGLVLACLGALLDIEQAMVTLNGSRRSGSPAGIEVLLE